MTNEQQAIIAAKSIPQNSSSSAKAPPKCPPINITGDVAYNVVDTILAAFRTKESDFTVQITGQGIKVFSSTTELFNKVKNRLRELDIEFFTHQLREEQTTKIVLHGLYEMSEPELLKHLKDLNINPKKLGKLKIRNKRFSDHCVYILSFLKKDKIKISSLREITAICQVKVRWEYYTNKRGGPMQCSRCMQYGHGSQNCFLTPVCIRCGESHKSSECRHLTNPTTGEVHNRIPDELIKCGLCGQNHSANYSQCEKRIAFIQRQQRFRQNTQRRNHNPPQPQQNPHFNTSNFPPLDPRSRANRFFPPPPPPQLNHTFASVMQQPQEMEFEDDSDLLDVETLMRMLRELTQAIRNARTRTEQISAVAEITLRYSTLP